MALIAADARERAEQLLLLTERLTAQIDADRALIETRAPLPDGPAAQERMRLANAYRAEMALIEQDPSRLTGLPAPLKAKLKAATERFQAALDRQETALQAVKELTEGLVQAMAEEVQRQRTQRAGYDAGGGYRGAGPSGVALDSKA